MKPQDPESAPPIEGSSTTGPLLQRARDAVAGADALVIAAGAGMGVDSGLPDFRGPEGFWRAYPAYNNLGQSFQDLANPRWFAVDPRLAWGFYGHRMMLYRRTVPHAGFGILKKWGERMARGAFVFTSNVDCHFQAAGFPADRLLECHGTLSAAQCTAGCGVGIFSAEDFSVEVDPETFRAEGPLPACPRCGALARPNILMFGDFGWESDLADAQQARLEEWLSRCAKEGARLVLVELGAGTGVPTVRHFTERTAEAFSAPLVRVNVREPHWGTWSAHSSAASVATGVKPPPWHIGVPMGALAALTEIDRLL